MNEQQYALAGSIVALGATITDAMDAVPGFAPCGTPTQVIIGAISALANGSSEEVAAQTQRVQGFVEHVSQHRGVAAHTPADLHELSTIQEQLAQEVRDFAAVGEYDQTSAAWLYRSLAALERDDAAAQAQLDARP